METKPDKKMGDSGRYELVPHRRVGNGRLSIDWGAYIRTGWPMMLAVIGLAFFLGGRLETPSEKMRRIERITKPLYERIRAAEIAEKSHIEKGGHREMELRMSAVERRMNSIDLVEREETEILRGLAETAREYLEHARRRVKPWDFPDPADP